jgi:hypothetical protein
VKIEIPRPLLNDVEVYTQSLSLMLSSTSVHTGACDHGANASSCVWIGRCMAIA